ncbi:DUF6247 family protein [Actinomycetospora termitidis]|uniref:DUF6247 family protein n=1 Tax=Actinomycetospora termitidis TaxID=3053470 RepID=A0ABT7MIY5_9PSEU|nr:DUF6247 family protein [Actinomycetospora sp. Odt1-22]MDL5160591.1 DUF6247 family protein [Actinomycetospora sp. Odt1-22]
MVATESLHDEPEPDLQALAPGAAPEVIREYLLPADRERFDAALSDARAGGGEDRIWNCVERWRGIAVLQADRRRFRRLARQIAERTTGVASPDDEPLEVTRAKAHI